MTNLQKLKLPKDKSLFAHQIRFIEKNPDRAMLVHETGTGKTVTACMWMQLRPEKNFLIACPKGIIKKWVRDLKEWNVDDLRVTVVSRDEIKKIDLDKYDGIVLDEAQDYSSPLFDKSRSQRAEVVYKYVKKHPDAHVLLLTATPVRSTPWNIHTLGCYLKIFWDVREFRNKFFHMTDKYGRLHYEKNKGWQKEIRPFVEEMSDIVLMSECVDVPQQHHKIIKIPWTQKQENELEKQQYMEPSLEWHSRHRMEQGLPKWEKLEELINGYRKVIVVCHYRSQIDDYVAKIGDQRLVYVLNGSVKDQDKVIEEAKSADDCVFIIQAQMGAGFDAGEFSVVIFASMSFRYVDYVQMKGRVKRINNLHENTFIHLIGGKNDQSVYNSIKANKDFDVHDYLTGTTKKIEQARSEDHTKNIGVVSEELPF